MKVLIADDTKNIRLLLTTCLEISGYEVSSVSSGNDAIEALETEHFDLAFVDIKMPEISGTEVLRRIRAHGITTPIVIMTAFATVKNAIECTKLGIVAYLQKPFTAEKVKDLLQHITNSTYEAMDYNTLLADARKKLYSGDIEESFSLLKDLLAKNPTCGEVYYLLAKIYEIKNLTSEANKFYEVAKTFSYTE